MSHLSDLKPEKRADEQWMSQQLVLAIRQAISSAACRIGGESKSVLRGDREIWLGHQVPVTPRWKGMHQGPSLPFPITAMTKEAFENSYFKERGFRPTVSVSFSGSPHTSCVHSRLKLLLGSYQEFSSQCEINRPVVSQGCYFLRVYLFFCLFAVFSFVSITLEILL